MNPPIAIGGRNVAPAVAELANIPRWVLWKLEHRNGKATKPPYQVGGRFKADSTKPTTWDSFDACWTSAFADGQATGIGIVLDGSDDLMAADLDRCIVVPEARTLTAEAGETIRRLNSYTEVSPSGRGLRVFFRGTMPDKGRKVRHLELYRADRFLTVTGDHWPGSPETIHHVAPEVLADLIGPAERPNGHEPEAEPAREVPDDLRDRLNEAMAEDPALWAAWNGEAPSGDDQSRSAFDLKLAGAMRRHGDFILQDSATLACHWPFGKGADGDSRHWRRAWEKAAPQSGDGPPQQLRYTLLADIKPNLHVREIVKDLIPRHALGEVHAEASGGKTAILSDLLLHVAAGLEYRGRRVERQPVVYVALEGRAGIDNRIVAARDHLGIAEAPFALVKTGSNFRNEAMAQRVAQIATGLMQLFGGDCPVVAIDTYTAALGANGSDCDPKDVTAFLANVQRHLLPIATVVILHHFGKDASRGGRGWSGLNAALDFELEIDRDDDLRVMRITKSRDGSDQQPGLCYQLTGHTLGTNEHGEPITAVVVEHLADEDTTNRGAKLSPKARAALNAMWEMIKDRARSFPLPGRPGLRCVLAVAWEAECIKPGVITKAASEKERRRKFRLAKAELETAGAIATDGDSEGRVYPTPKEAVAGGGDF